ncbi:MAG: hypothetical protein KY428_06335 [Bacteroidetes bacterium]|nr:hypothetical protein [Bacteroidota bacterium]
MKHLAPSFLSASLLTSYLVYSAFIPTNISHSIILFSLASLFAYTQFLLSRSTPKLEDEIAKLKSEMEKQLGKQKEFIDAKVASMEGDLTKLSFTAVKSTSSSSSSKSPSSDRKTYQF